MTTQTTIQQLAMPMIHVDDEVIYMLQEDGKGNEQRRTYGIFSDNRTKFELYEQVTHEYIDTFKSLRRKEFENVNNDREKIAYGSYYGVNTNEVLHFWETTPEDLTLTTETLNEEYITYKLSPRYEKGEQKDGVESFRYNQEIYKNNSKIMASPFAWAARDNRLQGMKDPENYIGRTHVHHITPDTLNDSVDNLILLTKEQHALMHTHPGSFTFKQVAELVTMLRVVEHSTVYSLVKSSQRLKQYLKIWLPSFKVSSYDKYHDYIYKRFLDQDNHKYNIWESVWDYETQEDKARINQLTYFQWVYYLACQQLNAQQSQSVQPQNTQQSK